MFDAILAENGLDGWVQIIILVLVFGGSALAAIGKKLISVFSPKEDPSPVKTAKPVSQPMKRAKPASPPAGVPPVLRPSVAQQSAPPPVVLTPVARPARPDPQRSRRVPTRSVPPPRLVPSGQPPKATTKSRAPGALSRLEPTVDDDLDRLGSRIAQRALKVGAKVSDHLGHLKPQVAEAWESSPGSSSESLGGSMSRLSRAEIRRAIVLREILGPPIALRSPDDGF